MAKKKKKPDPPQPEPVELNDEQYGRLLRAYRRHKEAQREATARYQAVEDLMVVLGGSDAKLQETEDGGVVLLRMPSQSTSQSDDVPEDEEKG